ncbi:hypothetical protein ACWD3Z_35710 [Streptomyces sp. NPDC002740]
MAGEPEEDRKTAGRGEEDDGKAGGNASAKTDEKTDEKTDKKTTGEAEVTRGSLTGHLWRSGQVVPETVQLVRRGTGSL